MIVKRVSLVTALSLIGLILPVQAQPTPPTHQELIRRSNGDVLYYPPTENAPPQRAESGVQTQPQPEQPEYDWDTEPSDLCSDDFTAETTTEHDYGTDDEDRTGAPSANC